MAAIGIPLFILSNALSSSTYDLRALDYSLNAIEFQASIKPGVFSCIFYDVAPQKSTNNIFDAILKSPRLDHVAKYVVNGTYHDGLQNLPWNPSLLVIHSGNDVEHLKRANTVWNVNKVLELFNPTTKVLTFVNLSNWLLKEEMKQRMIIFGYTSTVFFDSQTLHSVHCNAGMYCLEWSGMIQPTFLFSFARRWYRHTKLTYIKNTRELPYEWNRHWMDETARYLNTESVEHKSNCNGTGAAFFSCLNKQMVDNYGVNEIIFVQRDLRNGIPRDFRLLMTSVPRVLKIAVPKDRPLNIAELLFMPFTLWGR